MKKNSTQFVNGLQQAIDAKTASAGLYTALHGALDAGSQAVPVLRRIAEDEERHRRGFSELYRSRTGRRYEPEIRRIPFHSVRHGILTALQTELAAQELYHEMHPMAPASDARDFLQHTRGDEVSHALWLLYLLNGMPDDDGGCDGEGHQKAFRCRAEAIPCDTPVDDYDPMPAIRPMPAMPPDRPR